MLIEKSLGYSKLENPLYVDQRYELMQSPNEENVGHLQRVVNHIEPMIKDDAFINHMGDLGVLDWGLLKICKSNEKRIPPRFNNNSTLVESRSVRVSRNKNKIQETPIGSPLDSLGRQRFPPRVRLPSGKLCLNDQMVELDDSHKGEQVDQMNDNLIDEFSGVSQSCPLPLSLGSAVEWSNEAPVTPIGSRSLKENSRIFKKHDLDMYEQMARKCSQPLSPNRRFNFSFGKMVRSHSLNESTNRVSPDSVNNKWKKSNGGNRSRSSPLRRFLDPLLKPRGAHLAERVHKSKLDRSPTSISHVNENELLQIKKHRSSNVQALLQLTLKNGTPFFKLLVEGSSDLLAAAVKKLPSGNDASLIYAFFSVHETKKKSGGWMYQSSKEKGYSFEYNTVGQMKITSSYHDEFSGIEKCLYVVRESVLYSTETTRADQKTLDCKLEGELAAIIVKNPSDETCGDIGSAKTTTVVLPDHVHSMPNSGSPSPLINRWRSGGVCDCGGWDIGCQFHVLASHQNEILKTLTTPSTSSYLDLCYQVGRQNKCGFRLVSVEDGLYSLEYDPSMSLLQAFSICVAVVSSQKLTHIFEVNYVPESKDLSKPTPTDNEKVNTRVSKPPASSVAWV